MPVRIRLSRGGSKKRPFFHVVATNSRSSRDGKYIERLMSFEEDEESFEDDMLLKSLKNWEFGES